MILVLMGTVVIGLFVALVVIGADCEEPGEDEEQMREIRKWMDKK